MPFACYLEGVLHVSSEVSQCSLDCTFDNEFGTSIAAPSESRSEVVRPALLVVGML